ncbi:tetraacyldisaccharide 4'-kinase [Formicincola oecophyllae]|uniref:Tetraacyldisaccharide 4'-kinase n=1 Tax=Formicincola oecophyllae TaxID=2558361 RepID=A0A4Y6U7A8_9PROT|nr:tetraacyldisaccharide 4'-kinase [Formicincola oecophyllae]QDH12910.1 tetraacyldisaccharide 4'-kinase [Formicincola oecophyllae]
MKLRAPSFWTDETPSWKARFFAPFSAVTLWGAHRRASRVPVELPVPVLCCGGISVGGSGKTPLALDMVARLKARGLNPHVLTRGYGGRLRALRHGIAVTADHSGRDVGDEALLHARLAPTWAGRKRLENAWRAVAAGADCLVLDDGFQDRGLHVDAALLTVDGATGLGNGRLLPAGPLRERAASALARAHAVVVTGRPAPGLLGKLAAMAPASLPFHQVRYEPLPGDVQALSRHSLIAFAGLARPEKFFETLTEAGLETVRTVAFADHHLYSWAELQVLSRLGRPVGTALVTTTKDAARLPPTFKDNVHVLRTELRWDAPTTPEKLLDGFLERAHQRLQGQQATQTTPEAPQARPASMEPLLTMTKP